MKKLVSLLLAMLMAVTMLTASAEALLGGWTLIESLNDYNSEAADAAWDAFFKAAEAYQDAHLEMRLPLATQLVSGTNSLVLVTVTSAAVEPASAYWALATIYVDLQGNASITNIQALDVVMNGLEGGWHEADITDDEVSVIFSAMDALTEQDVFVYSFAELAQQIVAGRNLKLLTCYAVPAASTGATDEEPSLTEGGIALATVFLDLQGNATVTDFTPVALGASAQ